MVFFDLIIFRLFDVFVGQPVRIWCVSALLGGVFLLARLARIRYPQVRSLPLLIVALLWLAFGFEEREATLERADIRVDLLVIDPVLFFATAIAIVLSAASVFRATPSNPGKQPDLQDR